MLQHAGLKEIIQPISWAMRTLARKPKPGPRKLVISVPVDRVLSNIWMMVRVANIFEKSTQGTRPLPVSLSRVHFKNENFYIVEDGHHRCETAKMKGQKTVRAEISEERHFVPQDWCITRQGFKHVRTGKMTRAAKDLRAAARWLGVSVDRTSAQVKSSRENIP